MDGQAINVHGRIAFSNANCALPKTAQKRRWRKVLWHITTYCCNEKLGRYPGKADIAEPAFHGYLRNWGWTGCAICLRPRPP
jgi:hypothetical protein